MVRARWIALVVAGVAALATVGACAGDSDDGALLFAVSRAEADQSPFGPVLESTGQLIVDAEFETSDEVHVVTTASVSFFAFRDEADGPARIMMWLELDAGDDPQRCFDEVRAEPTAFRSQTIGPMGSAELTLVAPITLEAGGPHDISVCARASGGGAASSDESISIYSAGVSGVGSTNPANRIVIEELPS